MMPRLAPLGGAPPAAATPWHWRVSAQLRYWEPSSTARWSSNIGLMRRAKKAKSIGVTSVTDENRNESSRW